MQNANVKIIYKENLKLTLKCLVQKRPESVDQLVIPYQISLFRETDHSFRLQNILKQGLETWCLLIHERHQLAVLISQGPTQAPLHSLQKSPFKPSMKAPKAGSCSD